MSARVLNISDTAKWVAYYRAEETDRSDALFRDPYARKLAGMEGKEITGYFDKGAKYSWVLAIRTFLIDQMIMNLIKNERIDTVLNLACGLDTRPYRLKLPADLNWIGVDLSPLLEYKRKILIGAKPKCHLEEVDLDLASSKARRDLFSRVNQQSKKTLVITEGLLIYLSEGRNRALAKDLGSFRNFSFWITDIYSPFALKLSSQVNKKLTALKANFQFAPRKGTQFFAPFGWKERQFTSFLEDGVHLKRLPAYGKSWSKLVEFLPIPLRRRIYRMSGICLLKKA